MLPPREIWFAFGKYLVLIQILWTFVYGGADLLASQHSYKARLHFDVELHIPFYPAAAVIYLSLLPLLWISPFIFASVDQLRRFAGSIAILICLSGIGFLLLPSTPAYPPEEATGAFARVFRFMDSINLTHNMCPSLHVSMAVAAAYAYTRRLTFGRAAGVWLWTSAIVVSTLLTHQHHVVDLVSGGVLGWWVTSRMFSDSPADQVGGARQAARS